MSKRRVETINKIKCITDILDPEIPDIFDLDEGDVFVSDKSKKLIVVADVIKGTKNCIVFYENGNRKHLPSKYFRAYLISISAIPSHKTKLQIHALH